MKTRVIFASLVLGLGLAISQADAATTIINDDSPAAKKPASAMLVNGSEKQFAAYLERNVNHAHNTNWQNFMRVVSLYNQNPAAVLTISPVDRVKFNEAMAQINTQLIRQKSAEANRWINQADLTARMINFIWNANQPVSEMPEIQ